MGALGTTEYVDVVALRLEAEREECEWLLTSGALGRSGNLARVLRYVCDEYFEGRADQIKEYTIALEALGRRPEFDPQTDTIVRVTVHALRKRLLEVYRHEGADRPVRLILPPGHYAPSFVHPRPADRRHAMPTPEESFLSADASPDTEPDTALISAPQLIPAVAGETNISRGPLWRSAWTSPAPYLVALLVVVTTLAVWWLGRAYRRAHPADAAIVASGLPLPAPQATIHALMGSGRTPYVDHSGNRWTTGNYCQSGTNVTVPKQRIEGTEDAPLYLGGVRGIAHCAFPVPPGLYEMHLYFAETSDLPEAWRAASIAINAQFSSKFAQRVDVVDDAGGHGIATSTIVTGVARENDGSIHLDYVSEVSLLNAVQILPAPSASQLPVRIVANSNAFTDDAKQVWASDMYFSGGRHSQQLWQSPANLRIYQSARIGRFRYNIPAVPFAHYRVKLYFREPWFGDENGGIGGPGSRVFDVACNGVLLLKNFDILAEGNSKPIVKTFENIQASASGRIELYFMPVVNYAAVSAIEVIPED
jgi:Malectin domain